jgi:hypothetical protein
MVLRHTPYICITLSCTLLLQVGRMKSEVSTDLSKIGLPVRQDFEKFAKDTGRKLHLEIEPGTFLVANVGSLVSTVQDIVSTGSDGHTFIKVYTSQYTTYYLMQHSIKAQYKTPHLIYLSIMLIHIYVDLAIHADIDVCKEMICVNVSA